MPDGLPLKLVADVNASVAGDALGGVHLDVGIGDVGPAAADRLAGRRDAVLPHQAMQFLFGVCLKGVREDLLGHPRQHLSAERLERNAVGDHVQCRRATASCRLPGCRTVPRSRRSRDDSCRSPRDADQSKAWDNDPDLPCRSKDRGAGRKLGVPAVDAHTEKRLELGGQGCHARLPFVMSRHGQSIIGGRVST